MVTILTNVRNAVIAGFVLALLVFVIFVAVGGSSDVTATLTGPVFWQFVFRWFHVLLGILWIGLLYYFNFVQIPMMPKIPDEQKPAVSKFIAPEALWYFRWAAMGTIATGLVLAYLNGYFLSALTIGLAGDAAGPYSTLIGIGMWLGSIMWFNVWFVIWPNQQKALNIDNKFPDLTKEQKAAAGRTAMLFSRTNFMLSIPMLFAMVGAQHLG
ncbi:MAG: urate hydroxylase PuuD [Alphaproteobacteria bacterium]|nr:urate hydroxylase PuuD [Alphaproteobacteria bacterium]